MRVPGGMYSPPLPLRIRVSPFITLPWLNSSARYELREVWPIFLKKTRISTISSGLLAWMKNLTPSGNWLSAPWLVTMISWAPAWTASAEIRSPAARDIRMIREMIART